MAVFFSHIRRNDSERHQYHIADVGLKDGASFPFFVAFNKGTPFFISGSRQRCKDVHLMTRICRALLLQSGI